MNEQQETYIRQYRQAAEEAARRFHLNPVVILAQGALESAWGTSNLAQNYNNFFGITAYGATNAFWHGARTNQPYKRSHLDFRRYDTPQNSFLDFARLLRTGYPSAAAMSRFPADYAKEIAYSPYISELNGDNREKYREMLIQLSQEIEINLSQS